MAVVKRLGADDWAEAALEALRTGGVTAVTMEGLAARLGATKGSGYWHHASREALLHAALDLWERRETEEVIAELETVDDPVERLSRLLRIALGDPVGSQAELALGGHPAVEATVRRVTARRLAVLEDCFRRLGHRAGSARSAARTAYAVYLGLGTLRSIAPESIPTGAAGRRYVEDLTRLLTTDPVPRATRR